MLFADACGEVDGFDSERLHIDDPELQIGPAEEKGFGAIGGCAGEDRESGMLEE